MKQIFERRAFNTFVKKQGFNVSSLESSLKTALLYEYKNPYERTKNRTKINTKPK